MRPTASRGRLFTPVDPASLAAFRIGFGAVLFWGMLRYFTSGRIGEYYCDPAYHFTYLGFEWVRPLPGVGMYWHFGALGVLALLIAIGLWYRVSCMLFCLGFTYVFLIEQGRYLNHHYLVILLSILMCCVPANAAWSIDSLRANGPRMVPRWALGVLRTQVGLVYFYAGLAKLNGDWLRALPLRMWLPERSDHPVLGRLLAMEWNAWVFSYGALLLDLLAWPLLSSSRTRWPTFLVVVAFHLTNASLFGIGIFPWVMIAASSIFFAPEWPLRWLPLGRATRYQLALPAPGRRRWITGLIVSYFAFQFLFPMRHVLYPGRVSWTEEGHMFAWHMKLRDKDAVSSFLVKDVETGEHWVIDPSVELTTWQYRKMSGRPDMIHQYALHLAERLARPGAEDAIEVRASVSCSLNGREGRPLIDPSVDLTKEPRGLAPAAWILPLADS